MENDARNGREMGNGTETGRRVSTRGKGEGQRRRERGVGEHTLNWASWTQMQQFVVLRRLRHVAQTEWRKLEGGRGRRKVCWVGRSEGKRPGGGRMAIGKANVAKTFLKLLRALKLPLDFLVTCGLRLGGRQWLLGHPASTQLCYPPTSHPPCLRSSLLVYCVLPAFGRTWQCIIPLGSLGTRRMPSVTTGRWHASSLLPTSLSLTDRPQQSTEWVRRALLTSSLSN